MASESRILSIVSHKRRLLRKGISKSNQTSPCCRISTKPIHTIRSFSGSSQTKLPIRWSQNISIRDESVKSFIGGDQKIIPHASIRRFLSSSTTSPDRLFQEELNILYDSKCNVCKFEMDFLAKRDASRAMAASQPRKLKLSDLEDADYDPNDPANGGVTYAQAMTSMHAVKPDGQIVEGVAVFSVAYDLVGLGWLFRFTEWPITKPVVQWGYHVFAKYRTSVTRGSSLESLIEAYEARQASKQPAEDCGACNNNIASKRT